VKDYYEILEVPVDATAEAIKEQYRFLAHAWHPDKFPSPSHKAKAEERIKEINEAYAILGDVTERALYDMERRGARTQADRGTRSAERAEPQREARSGRWTEEERIVRLGPWVTIPAGEFLYGDEKEKRILPAFQIMRYPVTQAQYQVFIDANPEYAAPFDDADWAKPYNWDRKTRRHPAGKSNHPVVLVSWNDAQAYCQWAGLRLPAEEEWEKAARGTDGRLYPWGNQSPDKTLCNFNQNERGTTPVGKYSPKGDSPNGCADMAGNVWEWTMSKYDASTYALRGGSWSSSVNLVRTAPRYWVVPSDGDYIIGFRCSLSP